MLICLQGAGGPVYGLMAGPGPAVFEAGHAVSIDARAPVPIMAPLRPRRHRRFQPRAGVAELVDALDSKSSSSECGFDSHLEYNLNVKFNQNPVNINIYRVFHFI